MLWALGNIFVDADTDDSAFYIFNMLVAFILLFCLIHVLLVGHEKLTPKCGGLRPGCCLPLSGLLSSCI